MPDIGSFHPQIVHFVVVLLFFGVGARVLALTGRFPWMDPSASVLLLCGVLAAAAAVRSGSEAHGPAERIPGARATVQEHERWGERTRNILLVVGLFEVAALALRKRPVARRWALMGSAVVGAISLGAVFRVAELGGEVVYSYAGGVGTRSGDTADVQRLLTAGLYHQAMRDRAAGRREDAARLIDELVRRHPDDAAVRLLAVESLVEDRRDGRAALDALAALAVPDDDQRVQLRRGVLAARAYQALGLTDSARLVVRELVERFPDSQAARALAEQVR